LTPIQAAGIAAIFNPRKFTATSSSSSIIEREKNYACDANGREDKILIYVKKDLYSTLLDGSYFCLGQGRTREIGLITENLYTSSKNDKYYTNGLEIFYRF
jgi:hypothetical protein